MTIEEMFRRIVRGHLWLIGMCVLLPVAALVAVTATTDTPSWDAKVRIQMLSAAPVSATEAEGLSSRMLALATTPSLVQRALDEAKVPGDAEELATHQVSVARLGESSVVELTVTGEDAREARRLVKALAKEVTAFMNQGSRDRFNAAMSRIDAEIQAAIARRDALTEELTRTVDLVARGNLRVRLSAAQSALNQLTTQRSTLTIADLERDQVVTVDAGRPAVTPAPSSMVPRTALALLFGLVLGLVLAVAVEALRPRIAGIRVLARRLAAPVLGTSSMDRAALTAALTLAARRQGVETIVLVGVDERDERTVHRLLTELHAPRAVADALSTRAGAGRAPAGVSGPAAGGSRAVGTQDASRASQANRGADRDAEVPMPATAVRFTDVARVTPDEERTAGVVVVSGGSVLESQLLTLDDLLQTVRWPVIGIIETVSRRPSGGAR
jgi:capsular polysaccharide biosynthesis protein